MAKTLTAKQAMQQKVFWSSAKNKWFTYDEKLNVVYLTNEQAKKLKAQDKSKKGTKNIDKALADLFKDHFKEYSPTPPSSTAKTKGNDLSIIAKYAPSFTRSDSYYLQVRVKPMPKAQQQKVLNIQIESDQIVNASYGVKLTLPINNKIHKWINDNVKKDALSLYEGSTSKYSMGRLYRKHGAICIQLQTSKYGGTKLNRKYGACLVWKKAEALENISSYQVKSHGYSQPAKDVWSWILKNVPQKGEEFDD